MLGCVYLILGILLGREVTRKLLPEKILQKAGVDPLWVLFPAAFGSGILLQTWAVYIAAWIFSVCAGAETPLFGANCLIMSVVGVLLAALYFTRWKKGWRPKKFDGKSLLGQRKREILFFALLLAGIFFIMFYVFHMKDGRLYAGFSVFGDYAPHTAMMRSFSRGNNFPTQYPHFGGEDVKYHFMFQFLSGNLEYLGMPIEIAYNSVSILSLWCFFMLIYSMAKRVSGKCAAGVLAVLFVVFRSGTAFFRFIWEHLQSGDLLQTLSENSSFIGYTQNENWGLWNFNVYLNQRHLSFGLLIVAVALWVFWEWLEAGCACEKKGVAWVKHLFFTREGWKCRAPEDALLVGLLLGLCSFWNGAAVIGGLLILMGFAIFSEGKLDYLITAIVTVFFSMIQSQIFVRGSVVSPSVYLGFLAEDKTLLGCLAYLFEISGVVFLGVLVLGFFVKRRERAIMISMLFPVLFAFIASLTPDIAVNHKYIMISYAFLTIFWGMAVCILFSWKKAVGKIAAVILCICMTFTGIYDFVIVIRDNDSGHRISVDINSKLTEWLSDNLKKDDLILTPEYSMNEVTMSGVMMYLGWPYYAWSAGYDTYYRAAQAIEIYTTDSSDTLRSLVEQEKITYILYEEGMTLEQNECREDVIAATYPEVDRSEDGRIRIYETK